MALLSEILNEAVHRIITPIPYGIQTPEEDAILDVMDPRLEQTNARRAENIASFVRKHGYYGFGPMWSELNGELPTGGTVDIQSSKQVMVGHVHPTGTGLFVIHLSWDRRLEKVNSLGVWYPQDHRWLWHFHVKGAYPGIPYPSSESLVPRIHSIALTHMEHAIQQFDRDMYLG
jgi:hypothetical protein